MKIKEMRLAIHEIKLILAQADEDGELVTSPVFGPMFLVHGFKITQEQMNQITAHLKTLETQLNSSNPWDL